MKVRTVLISIFAMVVICGCRTYSPTAFTIAYYNLRNANDSDSTQGNGWSQRLSVIARIVPLPNYDYIGVGRNDGKAPGKHSAIFYHTDKFEVPKKGASGYRKCWMHPVKTHGVPPGTYRIS